MKRLLLAASALGLAATSAGAQALPIGPFQGTFRDDLESQPAQSNVACVVGRLFDEQADICCAGAISLLTRVVPDVTPAVPGPRSGTQMFHTEWGVTMTFDRPVRRFGGYFGGFSGSAAFVDTAGQLVGPAEIRIVRGDVAVGDRVTETDDAADVLVRQHVDATKEVPVVDHPARVHSLHCGEVTRG